MENYNERLNTLTEKVNDIVKINTQQIENKSFLSNIIPKNINKNYIIIGSIPICIIILLIVLKPKFILYKDANDQEKINVKTLLILSILSLIIGIGINYVYFYKKT